MDDMEMTYRPYSIDGEARQSRWLITCDHAANTVPPELGGTLGLHPSDMARHIAFDVGAAGVARGLGEALAAPVVCSNFSRLVIDPNRGEDDPTLVMQLYDGSVIPGNRHITAEAVAHRLKAFYRPYHDAVHRLAARRDDTVVVSVHSFTPQLRGRPARPWHVGILHAHDSRLSDPLLDILGQDSDLHVARNEPYDGALEGDALDRHALRSGRLHTLLEIRNDLIEDEAGQAWWATRLARALTEALDRVDQQKD